MPHHKSHVFLAKERELSLFKFLLHIRIFITKLTLIFWTRIYSIFYSETTSVVLDHSWYLWWSLPHPKSFRGCPTVLRPVERKRGSTWSRLPDFTPGYTLFSSPRYFFPPSSSYLSSGPGPPFDPVHDSSGEGATQPEYLRVRETSERSKKKEERKKRRTRSRERERKRQREKENTRECTVEWFLLYFWLMKA